ncbi:rhomboid family intramembrane serine protease [Limoniibacter endophyticus]|uniref:Rhomboid family intramembrane serine protease n=1 Tax=Limoniibacter endophyticus TaxID=1565040 RepID=A0A8J3DE78_9HYPH|nr:rhomboid family intramembrane serine protease [Limoniibacter endophyticus]GHC62627.1 rhomboid family intramembrane serine protease [Limoniibacter endophyticus]
MNDSTGGRGEPLFNIPGIITALIAICAFSFILQEYVLDSDGYIAMMLYGAFIPARYLPEYGGWDMSWLTSPFTYAFLHASWAHLIINSVWLAAFGSPLVTRLGTARFLGFWLFSSLCAVALHYFLHTGEMVPVVGASGAISGMMGAAARFGFQIDRSGRMPAFQGEPLGHIECLRYRPVLTFVLIWFAVNFVTGMVGVGGGNVSQIAWEAHVGGFLAGFLVIDAFTPRRDRSYA